MASSTRGVGATGRLASSTTAMATHREKAITAVGSVAGCLPIAQRAHCCEALTGVDGERCETL